MAEKKDFMSELAKSIEAQKRGDTSSMQNIEDFTPKARNVSKETDYDSLLGYENEVQTPSTPQEEVHIPEAVYEEPAPVYTEPEPVFVQPEPVEQEPRTATIDSFQTRPASFSSEQFQKIEKPKRSIPKWVWLLLLLGLLLLGGLIYYLFFAPKIVVPDCVGENISCVTDWAKQNRVENSSLVRHEEYNNTYNENIVIDQSLQAGKKVKPTTPFTITVSLGPDPDEAIAFPADIKNMTQEELNEWKNENKLLKTKITTQYSDTVPSGGVISYEVRNGSEDNFTRGTTLNVVTSKGPAPAGQVTVDKLEGKTLVEIETWASQKKINLIKQEAFNDKIEAGYIISSDKKQGDTIREGDSVTVVVSRGKGVHIPNLVGYTKEQLEAWQHANTGVVCVPTSIYNPAPEGSVISQSITGQTVESGTVLELTVSKYLPILETHSREWLGKDYLELKAVVDGYNAQGANIQAGEYGAFAQRVCSDEFPVEGMIVNYTCEGGTLDSNGSTHYSAGCERPLNLNSRIGYQVSSGPCTVATPDPAIVVLTNYNLTTLQGLLDYCNSNGIYYDELVPVGSSAEIGGNVRITYNGQSKTENDLFTITMNKGDHIKIEYSTSPTPAPTSSTDPEN